MTVHAGFVKFTFKNLDLYNVKSHAFVKLANLAIISKKIFEFNFFLHRHTYLFIYICIIDV